MQQKIFFGACLFFVIAFLADLPAILSISIISFPAIALLGGNFAQKWQDFKSNKAYLAVTSLFFIIAFSGFYSELTPFYWDRVRVALPFLVLPIAFSSLPKLSKKQFQQFYYFLVTTVFLVSVSTFINYLSDYTFLNEQLNHGRPIPTPIHHIRYSLLIAFTIIIGCWLIINKTILKYKWERFALIGMTIFLFIWLHILSVRSGIAVLYVTLFLLSLQYVFKTKRYILGVSVMLMIVAAPFIAYQTIKSFQNRINYALDDFQNYQQGEVKNFSDGERMISLQTGLEIGNANPFFGIGIGDLNNEIERIYAEKYEGFTVKRPHNQFIFFYAAIGIIGTIAFLIAFVIPLFYKKNYKNELIMAFHIIVLLSFMVENTIGTAIGTAFYSFFLLFNIK
jgi:O-antigen ligase